jgi:3',5'-cyclic AMP phosphodiesterase CpdA
VQKKFLNWLHLSDIHFSRADSWRDDVSRDSLLTYLKNIFICQPELAPDFIFCTGDVAFGELRSDPLDTQYESAKQFFDQLLHLCGDGSRPLPKSQLFIVPGNHDINRAKVNLDAQAALIKPGAEARDFARKINQRFDAKNTEFCDAMRRLDEYTKFIKEYLPHQHDQDGRATYSRVVDWNGMRIGIAGFNSAWSCAGSEDDRNIWLAAEWQFNHAKASLVAADLKIGLVHHPIDWFNIADREVATVRVASDFDFWLHGHTHSAWVTPVQSHTVIAAGAVGADHSDEFGINLTSIDLTSCCASTCLHTRTSNTANWTIAPIAEHAPLGKWNYTLSSRASMALHAKGISQTRDTDTAKELQGVSDGFVQRILSKRLSDSLRSFSSYTSAWVARIVSEASELDSTSDKAPKLEIADFVGNPISCVISAPPQYGLTCLAHFIALEAWKKKTSSLFLYLDAKTISANNHSISQCVADELQIFGKSESDIKAVILDSWSADEKEMVKLLTLLSNRFGSCPIIVMQQIGATSFSGPFPTIPDRDFSKYFLWALSRNVMRNMVSLYNEAKNIGDEDAVTARLASDLDVLNLHRTPINCITLLKVSEFDFDENPVNRSEIIKRVLFLLFNVDNIPNYKSRPDLKDCEYVLGRFCETLILTNSFQFARDKFLVEIQNFCKENLIDLETHLVFDILFQNNIIVKFGNFFRFKFTYWVYYFAAHRMHHDEKFATYIFEEMRYARFPEIIEFYTGIDRMRNDALKILIRDLNQCHSVVRARSGLPEDVNPYKFAVWTTDDGVQSQMKQEIADGVRDSNLPAPIKDQYADRNYDRTRPYNQGVRELMSEHSYLTMLHAMSAGARALRNSDYADPDIKRQLLREVMRCWNEATRVLFIVLPLLVQRGHAAYDGMGFYLDGEFGDTEEQRFIRILTCIPSNIMRWGREDLYSRKMAPLLVDRIEQIDVGVLEKHELILLLISTRPRDWEKTVHRYIVDSPRNSFYLMDVYQALRGQYRMGFFPNIATQKMVEFLIKMAGAKHITGDKKPTEKTFKNIKFDANIIPERESD